MAQSAWQKSHPDRVRELNKLWRKNNPERVKAREKKRWPRRQIERYRKAFGIDFDPRVGKSCEICGSIDNLVVDHFKNTRKIRSVLCKNCNLMIGYALEDPIRLVRAAEYLNKYNGSQSTFETASSVDVKISG